MSEAKVRIGILGAAGRMGTMLVREVSSGAFPCTLGAAADKGDDIAAAVDASDVLIDFTRPEATVAHARLAASMKKALVVGTTGLSAADEAVLAEAAKSSPVFYAANMSLGVNLLAALVEQAAARLKDSEFDIEIFEAHHKHKVDAPSGTALLLGRAAAAGRGVKLEDAKVAARDGITGARAEGTIGFSVFRGGDVIGDHTVTFAGEGERVELSHRASDRAVFARGAIRAAMWLKDKPAGLYGMKDLLQL